MILRIEALVRRCYPAGKRDSAERRARGAVRRSSRSQTGNLEESPGEAGAPKKKTTKAKGATKIIQIRTLRETVESTPYGSAVSTESEDDAITEKTLGAAATKAQLMDRAHKAVTAITQIATSNTAKLNKNDIRDISMWGQEVLAVVAHLDIRLAEAELEIAKYKLEAARLKTKAVNETVAMGGCTVTGRSGAVSYAGALKMGRGIPPKPLPDSRLQTVLAIYPENTDKTKTAEDTKKMFKASVDPTTMNLQVVKMRKIGNAGVIVQTSSLDSANKIRDCTEIKKAGLKISDPRQRKPLVKFSDLDDDIGMDKFLECLSMQNSLKEEWTLDALKESAKLAFKKQKRGAQGVSNIVECSPGLRTTLIEQGHVYIGWNRLEINDFIDVTCCNKCHIFGHPERFCREKEPTCNMCGEVGHRGTDCKAEFTRCATCHKFNKNGANDHRTNSKMVGQLNLQGARAASLELREIARTTRLDIIAVQEQYQTKEIHYIQKSPTPEAAVVCFNDSIACAFISDLSNEYCSCVHVQAGSVETYLVSAYFKYNQAIDHHLQHMHQIMLRLKGKKIIICADSNTHSPLWHSEPRHYTGRGSDAEQRRRQMECFIAEHHLHIWNEKHQPSTFSGPAGQSNIDVTLTTRNARIKDWKVMEGASSSDHQLLVFEFGGSREIGAFVDIVNRVRYRDRGVNWDRFCAHIERDADNLDGRMNANMYASRMCHVIETAALDCLGMYKSDKIRKYEWWNDRLDSLRKRSIKVGEIGRSKER
ncbi:Retrovirus-related Pol polyprotein from type-1 retrotransposable element R1 [Eumeta japonica]|uniref:Retrovirus-related Pol polyprotein from type-1 retrotransposable element R1 n=1 Tax=Eumeta variegata TaxID=151549 RepID=A0A4C2A8Z5_EUMVA|nr:Retrovirus-related Pol polyprotein from type-1 retrotransposable element R1 [Eumeta japonica]